jgi:hypothetical protein
LPKRPENELPTLTGAGYLAAPTEEPCAPTTLTKSAPEALKEVAQMMSNHIAMTEQIPSSIGMPAYGRALGAAAGVDVCTQTTTVVLGARISGMGRIKGDFPGTSAWRPPNR